MLNTGDRVATEIVTDTGLIAPDTGADEFNLSGFRLTRHVGIADHGTRHDACVCLTRGQDSFGILRLIDTSSDEYRHGNSSFCLCCSRGNVANLMCHRRNNVMRTRVRCRRSAHNRDIVHQPGAIEFADRVEGDLVGKAIVTLLVNRNPNSHRKVRADSGAGGIKNFSKKPHPALSITAILIGSSIGIRIKELRR